MRIQRIGGLGDFPAFLPQLAANQTSTLTIVALIC
jgi:hypothetical protein